MSSYAARSTNSTYTWSSAAGLCFSHIHMQSTQNSLARYVTKKEQPRPMKRILHNNNNNIMMYHRMEKLPVVVEWFFPGFSFQKGRQRPGLRHDDVPSCLARALRAETNNNLPSSHTNTTHTGVVKLTHILVSSLFCLCFSLYHTKTTK